VISTESALGPSGALRPRSPREVASRSEPSLPQGLNDETLLRAASVEEQRVLFAKWVKDLVLSMGCLCHEAEKYLAVPCEEFLKPGYGTFEGPRFERGTRRELLNCQKAG
jgi:hypothetical protein